MFKSVVSCDTCETAVEATPDDGLPVGWFQMAEMTQTGCWTIEREKHFCSAKCVKAEVTE